MAGVNVNNVEDTKTETENNILYELLTYAEWQQEPEILNRAAVEKCEDGGIWGWLGSLATSMSGIPPSVQRLRSFHMDWHFAVGGEGKVLAILQDQSIEIRSSRDEYVTVIGRGSVPKDPVPQWRRVVWSPDCSFLAVALSTGRIEFFDTVGSSLFHVPEPVAQMDGVLQDLSYAIAGMVFTEARVHKTQWSYELIAVNYRGQLKSYLLSPSDGYRDNHSFHLGSFYPKGVTCLEYHPSHQVLLMAGRVPTLQSDAGSHNSALELGITAWRFLSDYPHYKLVTSLAEDAQRMYPRRLLQKMSLYYKQCEETAYQLSISPSGTIMAAAHTSGAISFWSLPSLLHFRTWQLEELPKFNDLNPQVLEPGRRKHVALRAEATQFSICDMNWWSDEALIVAHHSGAVKVVSLSSKRNLLGESPEWFEFSPQVSGVFDRGFLTLECEWQFAGKKAAVLGPIDDAESSDEEAAPAGLAARAGSIVKHAMYYVTDSQRFAPPRKKPKIITKFYRLLCVKSTTPEELFAAKIDAEEYGEALALARTYGLDSDLVYQRQWRKSTASVAAIQDYLSKITKRTWVLHECLERVPDSLKAARELLEFGLRGTDVEAVATAGESGDEGRFIANSPPFYEDIYGQEHLTEVQHAQKRKDAEQEWRQKWLAKIDFANLTLDQRWLCECRLKLLSYLDRLTMYEIQEELTTSPEKFEASFFERFRSQPPLEAAVWFAQEGDGKAVWTLLTYAGDGVLPHWLTVLSNFPETLAPLQYADCLPEIGCLDGKPTVLSWQQRNLREKDWCEENIPEAPMVAVWDTFNRDFYDDNPSLKKWWTEALTPNLLTLWYSERAHQIEELSSLVENALEITKLGCLKNVEGLEKLYGDLLTLATLVYDCHLTKAVPLAKLEEMSDGEKMRLLMSMSTKEKFVLCVRDWLLPFVDRCEKAAPGSRRKLLSEFFTEVARDDLGPCVDIFEHSSPDDPVCILNGPLELAELALACICSCQRDDQLGHVVRILKCVPQRGVSGCESDELKSLHDRLDIQEKHVEVAECMQRYGARVSVKALTDCGEDREQLEQLLNKMALSAVKRSPALSETEWCSFLNDILQFQQSTFKNVGPTSCIKIVARALLCSGNKDFLAPASRLLTCARDGSKQTSPKTTFSAKLPYEASVELVLSAAREYVDSASSHADPSITLARACLRILEGKIPEVQAELDFLSALPLLSHFRVATLPVQVRRCDKMELIREALRQTPNAYKQSSKLLRLSEFLRLYGDDAKRREGAVLSLLADAAFQDKDYTHCYEICGKLMAGTHSEGWKICQSLGQCSDFADLSARQKLLAFSLCYCPEPTVEGLLKATQLLELQEIYQRLDLPAEDWFNNGRNTSPEADGKALSPHESGDSVQSDRGRDHPWDFVGYTAGTTRSVLTTLGSAEFWKGTVRNLTNIKPQKTSEEKVSIARSNHELKRLAVPAFYESLYRDAYLGKYEPSYDQYDLPKWTTVLTDLLNILRASTISDSVNETSPSAENSQETRASVLLGLSRGLFFEDSLLALCCLFAVEQVDQVEEVFLNLPSTPVVLGLASYFFSLTALMASQAADVCKLLRRDIADVIEEASRLDTKTVPEKTVRCAELAAKFRRLQADLGQAELLRKQGGSVDVARFAEDDRYKAETILGMALTSDQEALRVAVSLARSYDLPLWDVYSCHLEFLFSEGCGVADIEERLCADGMLDVLLENPDGFRDLLMGRIFPLLDGSDHSVMVFFYTLLEKCAPESPDEGDLSPVEHLKLLGKLRKSCPGIDYKALVSCKCSPLEALGPFLKKDNVDILADLAPSIPSKEEGRLSSSTIYCLWASKLFLSRAQERAMTTAEWAKHFETCKTFLGRLSPSYLVKFVESTAFHESAIECVSRRIRLDVVRQCLKMAKQSQSSDPDEKQQWSDAAQTLQRYLTHLQRVDDGVFGEAAMDLEDPVVQQYATEFELSRGMPDKLEAMLLRCAMSEHQPGLLPSLLSCCPPNTVDKQPTDIYSDAILLASEQLREPTKKLHPVFETVTPEDVLERILHQVLDEGEEVFVADMALDLLRPFCLDTNVAIQVRLRVLEILEKSVALSAEDENLLRLLRVQTLVWSEWPDYEVHESLELDDVTMQTMFDELVERCTKESSCIVLGKLLQCGTPLESTRQTDPAKNPWCRLLSKLFEVGGNPRDTLDAAGSLFSSAIANCNLSVKCCRHVLEGFKRKGSVLHLLRAAFSTIHQEVHKDAISFLRGLSEVSESDYDESLLERILVLHLLPEMTSTPLYEPLVAHLMANRDSAVEHFDVDLAVQSLLDADKTAEAGTLLLQCRRVHPALSTFSAALKAARQWVGRTDS
ncbi:neuroblastoma-amplified sequence [Ixodes scapularis]|uniref:neuroblastoma-amplified sequence n=1 Tax=Ixodes scapularis TaxID=6945 RepID=UPI001A9F14CD|nr:neuroblastoma-amplified sequence [Ixodes scapularis]